MHIRLVRISRRQRDLEGLAWAGGFFDGEGSTFARTGAARPDYRQLNVVVPQSGGFVIPEVLTRFADALPGLGEIGGPSNDLFQWRSTDYIRARATVATLMPWIGAVKRAQAMAAIALVDEQYRSGRYRARPWQRRRLASPIPRGSTATDGPTLDRAWAAGFLDAEGCFGLVRGAPRVGGQPWYRIRASASQHGEVGRPADVLLRLHKITGIGRIERHGEPDDFKWVAEGLPAMERVLAVVGPWLGIVKRDQARDSMLAFKAQVRLKGDGTHCKRGHAYDVIRRRRNGSVLRRCNACSRLRARRARAALSRPPRPFRNVARRYTE